MSDVETKDQVFYQVDGQWKATIDVDITKEAHDAPSMRTCRHAVLTIKNVDRHGKDYLGYVVYDRWLSRIVNGVFFGDIEGALGVAHSYNIHPDAPQDMSPNGYALGLTYPVVEDEEQAS